jgi:hypothetical protein
MDQHDDLIQIPLLSLESLLSERNLLSSDHDLWDVDAREIFHAWGLHRGYHAVSAYDDSEDATRNRRLQDIIGDGIHFIQLYVGNPAQLRVLALNSAGDMTAWPCEVSFVLDDD